jgi:hypothetical protein
LPDARAHADGVRCAERVAGACADVVGDALAGVVLHGSLTLGDFVPGRSDVDVLAIVERPLGAADATALGAALDRESPRAPGPVDLRVVTRAVASAPAPEPEPEIELHLRLSPQGESASRGNVSASPTSRSSSPCAAPTAGASPARRRHAARAGARRMGGRGGRRPARRVAACRLGARYAELMALTACRVWRFAAERQHSSKRAAAAEWVLTRAPDLGAVREALRPRAGDPAAALDEASVRELLAAARREASTRMRRSSNGVGRAVEQ